MKLTALCALGLAAMVTLCGCLEAPQLRPCFEDGVQNPANLLRSTICCVPGDSTLGDQKCRDEITNDILRDLVVCAADGPQAGTCVVDCRTGQNCECLIGATCPGDLSSCQEARSQSVCERHGLDDFSLGACLICAECKDHAACAGSGNGTVCICQECDPDSECAPDVVCEKEGFCGCRSDDDCAEAGGVCRADHTCGLCRSDDDCTSTNGAGLSCLPDGTCGCADESGCEGVAQGTLCRDDASVCGCTENRHCQQGKCLADGRCGACQEDADCVGNELGSHCGGEGKCTCLTEDECAPGQVCDPTGCRTL